MDAKRSRKINRPSLEKRGNRSGPNAKRNGKWGDWAQREVEKGADQADHEALITSLRKKQERQFDQIKWSSNNHYFIATNIIL